MNKYFDEVDDQPDYLQREDLESLTGLYDHQIQVSRTVQTIMQLLRKFCIQEVKVFLFNKLNVQV